MANLASAAAYHFPSLRGIVLKHICKDPNLIHGRTAKVLKVLQKENEFHLNLACSRSTGPSTPNLKRCSHTNGLSF